MGALMRARAVRDALGISVWDLHEMVACGTLTAIFPVGRWRGGRGEEVRGQRAEVRGRRAGGRGQSGGRGRRLGEKVPYYRRDQVEALQRGRGEE